MKVVIIGAGHNGLVAAVLLARNGISVTVVEEKSMIGGATKTEFPFAKVPLLGTSTGSYLLGLMPPELLLKLQANIPLIRRDPHYFLPTPGQEYLLFGSDRQAMQDRFLRFFSEEDWKANQALTEEISQLREDLAPSWLEEPISVEETAEKYIRKKLRPVFLDLVTQPVENYLERFGFKSELLMAMYAVTDGFSGLTGSFGTPRTGMNFLVHNLCRLPGSDGTFMIVKGGMGTVAKELARLARECGVKFEIGNGVEKILITRQEVRGVLLKSGKELPATVVLANCDPFRLRALAGAQNFSIELNHKLDTLVRPGTTMKINLALSRLPTFRCLPENRGQHNATIHLLPTGPKIKEQIRAGFEKVQQGHLADFPTIEWYIHTQADPSLQDPKGHHNSAFFVQWVPYELQGTTWEQEEEKYVKHLFSIAEDFAPGFTESVVDYVALHPKKIESHFGITHGHIHHVDNTFGFDQRMPYSTSVAGLYSCSAGCHPAGSVIGAAGYNSAQRVLKDWGIH